MVSISSVGAISRLSRVLMVFASVMTSWSWMWRLSSRKWTVMPSAPAFSAILAASIGSG